MPYVTVFRPPRSHQMSFDDIIRGEILDIQPYIPKGFTADTITRYYRSVGPDLVRKFDIPSAVMRLRQFNEEHAPLFSADRQSLYRTFYIPKRSGGLRRIDAPIESLMQALRDLKFIFESYCGALYHTSAFAYVPNRSTVQCVKRHQGNGSRWFLKVDFSDFFGSTTEDFLMSMLSDIFPFNEIIARPEYEMVLRKSVSLCFLNGGLPQGTPISPMLTNLMMIPIDFRLMNSLKSRGFVYTRYADDIIISNKYSFLFMPVIHEINDVLESFSAPFRIKKQKTRYGSSSGSNWILGVMLNSENNITIGWKKKKHIRALTCNYVLDRQNNSPWEYDAIASYNGLLSYCRMVEPSFFAKLVRTTNKKYSVDLLNMLHCDLNGGES